MKLPDEASQSIGEFIALDATVAAGIVTLIAAGWKEVADAPEVKQESLEVPLTERLRDGMRRACLVYPWAKGVLAVLPGSESRSEGTLVPNGRTDIPVFIIQIFLQRGVHDPHAIIECKRIAGSDKVLCREYVVEGVDRFRTGKYGFDHIIGYMVGYVISGDATGAADGVNAYLARVRRNTEILTPGSTSTTRVSEHPRAGVPIRLLHCFLEFA